MGISWECDPKRVGTLLGGIGWMSAAEFIPPKLRNNEGKSRLEDPLVVLAVGEVARLGEEDP